MTAPGLLLWLHISKAVPRELGQVLIHHQKSQIVPHRNPTLALGLSLHPHPHSLAVPTALVYQKQGLLFSGPAPPRLLCQ